MNDILLWGLNRAEPVDILEYLNKNNNPYSIGKLQKSKALDNEKKDTYTIDHIKYLDKELDITRTRIKEICDLTLKESDEEVIKELNEEYETLFDLEDKLVDLITEIEEKVEEKQESEEPILTLKKYKEEKVKVKFYNNKVRYAKNSEEAMEVGKMLTEARKKAREAKGITMTNKERADMKRKEKLNLRETKLKPWFYIGLFPKGYREANEDEAIRAGKISDQGKYKIVDRERYDFFVNYNIEIYENMPKHKILIAINKIPKEINILSIKIEKLENKLDSDKYSDLCKESFTDELKMCKLKYNSLIRGEKIIRIQMEKI
jgi:hypothetical protein